MNNNIIEDVFDIENDLTEEKSKNKKNKKEIQLSLPLPLIQFTKKTVLISFD